MPTVALRAHGLGKYYRIGDDTQRQRLGEALARSASSAWRTVSGRRSAVVEESQARGVWALRDVSFEIPEGDAIGFVGRNGAGKSTLLKILARITEPTTGRAEIRGRVGSLLEVGAGFQSELTGRENVYLNGAILGMRRAEIKRKFDEIVAFAELQRFIDTPVKHYSSGMYMRLAFAVAAHLEPDILLVDEALAVGDVEFQRKCLAKMGEVAREGRTVLFVSHYMSAVESLCNRVMWIDGGHLVDQGEPAAVISRYLQISYQTRSAVHWDDAANAPGDDWVQLQAARVVTLNGSPPESITVRTAFAIEVEYRTLQADARLSVSLNVVNEHGTLVFNARSPQIGDALDGPGVVLTRCLIPGDLLNDGRLRVDVQLVRDLVTVVHEETEAIVFDISEDYATRTIWHGKWLGAVRPQFDWEQTWVDRAAEDRSITVLSTRE